MPAEGLHERTPKRSCCDRRPPRWQVVLARQRSSGNEYALKVIDKHYIVR